MPFAPTNSTKTTQSAVENPCVSPYHGTRISAASEVSVNISTFTQMSGACSVRGCWSFMRVLRLYIASGRGNLARLKGRSGTCVVFARPAAPAGRLTRTPHAPLRRFQNLTMTPAPHTTSRVRRSGYQTPPSFAHTSAAAALPLLHTRLAGAPLLPVGGVTPPAPDQ